MKHLIVYYSHSGNNEKLALELKDRIGCEIFKINEEKKRKTISILLDFIFSRNSKLSNYDIDINNYDIVIFVAPIWGGKIASPMRTFIEKEKNNIKNYFYITLCNGMIGQKNKIEAELSMIVQHDSIQVKELWINSLLPEDKQNKVSHTFNYKVSEDDLGTFFNDIDSVVKKIKSLWEYADKITDYFLNQSFIRLRKPSITNYNLWEGKWKKS